MKSAQVAGCVWGEKIQLPKRCFDLIFFYFLSLTRFTLRPHCKRESQVQMILLLYESHYLLYAGNKLTE